MEDLVLKNIKLIYLVLKKYKLYAVLDDYFDVGMIGLVKAAKTYDEKKGCSFSTYAVKTIEHEIYALRRKEFALKRGEGQPLISLNSIIEGKDNTFELVETIPCKVNVEDEIIQKELYLRLYEEIDKLPETNKFILCSIFQLNNYERLTEHQLAKKLNCSQAQIHRIKDKTIKILREKLGGDF